jgi:hypothetical protein
VSDFTDFRQYAETLVAVYARCGAGPFLHREVAGIVPRQDIVRFACKNYFLRVQDRDGRRARYREGQKVWRLHPYVVGLCRDRLGAAGGECRE